MEENTIVIKANPNGSADITIQSNLKPSEVEEGKPMSDATFVFLRLLECLENIKNDDGVQMKGGHMKED